MAQGQSAPSTDPEALRVALDELGTRRRALKDDDKKLRDDTRRLLNAARGILPMTEACDRADIGRATVYQDYLDDREPASNGRAA